MNYLCNLVYVSVEVRNKADPKCLKLPKITSDWRYIVAVDLFTSINSGDPNDAFTTSYISGKLANSEVARRKESMAINSITLIFGKDVCKGSRTVVRVGSWGVLKLRRLLSRKG